MVAVCSCSVAAETLNVVVGCRAGGRCSHCGVDLRNGMEGLLRCEGLDRGGESPLPTFLSFLVHLISAFLTFTFGPMKSFLVVLSLAACAFAHRLRIIEPTPLQDVKAGDFFTMEFQQEVRRVRRPLHSIPFRHSIKALFWRAKTSLHCRRGDAVFQQLRPARQVGIEHCHV